MYKEYPYFCGDRCFVEIDGEKYEISREIANVMQNFYRASKPKVMKEINETGEIIRKQRREIPYTVAKTEDVNFTIDCIADVRADVEKIVMSQVDKERVHEAIEQLDGVEKFIICAVYFQNFTQRQVGKLLGISAPAVNKRIQKIFIKMRKILKN